jgi:dUTP pyrophosphatase
MLNVEIKYSNEEIAALYAETNGTPKYATQYSAAVDLRMPHNLIITPNRLYNINTGVFIHPVYSEGRVASMLLPRSGSGGKGLRLMNTVGLIDEDYQGELIVKLFYEPAPSLDKAYDKLTFMKGDRFCQQVFIPILHANYTVVSEFTKNTERGEGGFGHTGGS